MVDLMRLSEHLAIKIVQAPSKSFAKKAMVFFSKPQVMEFSARKCSPCGRLCVMQLCLYEISTYSDLVQRRVLDISDQRIIGLASYIYTYAKLLAKPQEVVA